MQLQWWHGALVLGLCAVSYVVGRTQGEAQTPVPSSVAQQDNAERRVNAFELSSAKALPVTTQDSGRVPAAVAPVSSAKGAPVVAAQQPMALPPSGRAAVESANRTLDDALNRRVWTDDDAQEFRHAIVDMPAEDRERLIRELTVAINSGQLAVMVDRGPPF